MNISIGIGVKYEWKINNFLSISCKQKYPSPETFEMKSYYLILLYLYPLFR